MEGIDAMELFGAAEVARGYAASRPRFHSHVVERIRSVLGPRALVARALDVGCGAGLSTAPLLSLAGRAVGLDPSRRMVTQAGSTPGAVYLVAAAEHLPFAPGSFELITASGAINWIDRDRFLPEARRALGDGGWLVVYDGAEQGAMVGEPAFGRWYRDDYLVRLPRPPRDERPIDAREARQSGLYLRETQHYQLEWPFDLKEYVEFMMTQSNTTAAVGEGRESAAGIRAWLTTCLEGSFSGRIRPLLFGGYIWYLQAAP